MSEAVDDEGVTATDHVLGPPRTGEIPGIDEAKAVYFELERGQCSLHDGRIIHGAKPNTCDIRRTGYTMRYFPASVKVLPVPANDGWKIWLARGRDGAGNTYQPDPR